MANMSKINDWLQVVGMFGDEQALDRRGIDHLSNPWFILPARNGPLH